MFRLAHISDIHLAPLPAPTLLELASKRITGYLNWQKNRRKHLAQDYLSPLLQHLSDAEPDHLIISGDLINLALNKEFETGAKFLKSLGSPENVSLICGNHDAYVPGAMRKAIDSWKPYLSGDSGPISSHDDYPVLRVRDDMALICCNSAEATLPFMATGYFRQAQAERLAAILNETRGMCRIVAIHHPPIESATPWYKRLIGDDLFREVIMDHGAELILHGHTHLATRYSIAGNQGMVPVICVPAAGNAPGGHRPAGRYNLFNISPAGTKWEITQQAWGWDQEEVSLLEEVTLSS